MYKKIVTLYELFYRGLYKQEGYIYSPSESAHKQIENFIKLLDKAYTIESIGNDFLITYFTFQFAYWSELNIDSYNKSVVISYIIGPKAFQRWRDRDAEYDFTIFTTLIKKTGLTKGEVLKAIEVFSDVRSDNLKHEEAEKKRFEGTDRQFLHCIENTTLIHPRSLCCIVCKDKADCKKLLEERFPQIYYHRFKK